MSIESIYKTDSGNLEALFDLKSDTTGLWRKEELAAIWRHQLAAPLDFDLRSGDEESQTQFDTAYRVAHHPPKTFGELFEHPHPPVDLLKLTKQFGKRHHEAEHSPLPKKLALLIYYVSIVVALVRSRNRITSLSDE